ncbi:4-hydroxy-tetrahydrodipicolinate reductase [Fontisphaera persica]|uniref:4-hydroxy-tetrahydrodipicolinate reductase n=1 Tax=Fontisphaera persica TaxID=2974023 RepID=UPI0024BF8A65|nr:4-hydroxy-tetrahydrodipicolinate reductase [Fontisphaera persica]WCJ59516.1 4-hydroxy-tetrahydrodipicolinate reductase [Fontisphaera persica]
MLKIIINGARGRMGQAIQTCAGRMPEVQVIAAIDLGNDLAAVIEQGDVVIEFSTHHVTPGVATLCAQHRKPLVIGTTGHTAEERRAILQQAQSIPMVWTANFSTGVNTLFWLTRKAAEILGPGYDLEIVEMHHRHKKDAPSGTAKALGEILAQVRRLQYEEAVRHGRAGLVGERTPAEIGMHAVRGGDVVGDHTVIFATAGERLELTHKASSRETFAQGALRAAQWVVGRPPGVYDMQDVLGLK